MDNTRIHHILLRLCLILQALYSNSFIITSTGHQRQGTASLTRVGMSTTVVGPEIEVISQPDDTFLQKKGVDNWGTWGCGVSKFPWTYDESESCYLLAGKVTVTPIDGRAPASFGTGDFVTFPAGMSCTWDVTEAVKKHYMFF